MHACTGLSGLSGLSIGKLSPMALALVAASSQYVGTGSNPSGLSRGSGSLSLCCWVKFNTRSANQTLIAKDLQGGGTRGYVLQMNGSFQVVCYIFNGSAVLGSVATAILSANTWYFLSVSYDSTTGVHSIAVNNGTAVTTTLTNAGSADTANFRLGTDTAAASRFLDGYLDAVGVWIGRALGSSDLTALYNSGAGLNYAGLSAGLKTNLAGWWDLEEASGNRIDATSTNALTPTNAPGNAAGIT